VESTPPKICKTIHLFLLDLINEVKVSIGFGLAGGQPAWAN
jgi:hypothetical protein